MFVQYLIAFSFQAKLYISLGVIEISRMIKK